MHMKKNLKLILFSICSSMLILTGCSGSGNGTNTSSAQSAEADFDKLTRELFVDYASQDTVTLNYTLKDPSAYGIQLDEVTWGDVPLSEDDFAEYKAETESYLARLNEISGLTGDRAVTYDVVKYYLEADLASYDYIYFVSNFSPMLGFQSQLPTVLAEYHFDDVTNVEDYLALLNNLGTYVDQLLAFEDAKAAAGYGMCRSALETAIEDCHAFCDAVDNNLLIEVFPDKLESLNLSDSKKADFIQQNQDAVFNSVLPAYQKMIDTLSGQLATAPSEGNLSSYKNGQNYYKYLLTASVGTDKTPEELIALTEEQLNTCIMDLSMIMMLNPDIFSDIESSEYALNDPDKILEHFKSTLIPEQFPEAPKADYTLKNVHESMKDRLSPAMYFIPRLDDIENNQIYLNLNASNSGNELMPTLAHEGYPGHMYQITYYYNTNPNPIRTVYENSGYSEGWASYVEGLSYDYCGFSEDVADFYRISNLTMALNLYCRLDLGIHYEGWDINTAGKFITQYLMLDKATIQEIYDTILYNPTNYLIYGIGMDEILELRENMEENLGDAFDVKEFHNQLLNLGPAPFPIIEKYMPDAAEPVENTAQKAA